MIRTRFRELLSEKERRDGRRIPQAEVARATGIAPQVLSKLTSPNQEFVTNTAYIEALCRYFQCEISDLLVLHPPLGEHAACHVDELYPNRRRQ